MNAIMEGIRQWLHGDKKLPRVQQARTLSNEIAAAKHDVEYAARQMKAETSNLENTMKCLLKELDRNNVAH